jgi:small subunit ribosomal protein S1
MAGQSLPTADLPAAPGEPAAIRPEPSTPAALVVTAAATANEAAGPTMAAGRASPVVQAASPVGEAMAPVVEPPAPKKSSKTVLPNFARPATLPVAGPLEATPAADAGAAIADAVVEILGAEETDLADEDFPEVSFRGPLTADLEEELNQAMGDVPLDDLLGTSESLTSQPQLELETEHTGRILAISRDNVFVELGSREQGVVSARQLPAPPEVGSLIQVIVKRYLSDDGLYELSIPNVAASVGDWSDLNEGMLVEAQVTGHNAGGLECEVNHLRGFIPVSQVSMYRVENLEEFVGQRFTCLVSEANPQRRNLVLSRRAVLERERADARQQLLGSLEVGQVRDGVVRKLMDFGAFVDLGGVDGLVHISQLSWARVKHPNEVLQEGQPIKVRINKIDPENGKISLGYRDMLENPWQQAAAKYPANGVARGVVTKLMEFGAFVQLEPGVEGLVHVSELSPKRVWRVADVVSEGQEVEVLVLSIDVANQRMSLSMKALAAKPEPAKKDEQAAADEPAAPVAPKKQRSEPLKGGLGNASGGDRFGLKW